MAKQITTKETSLDFEKKSQTLPTPAPKRDKPKSGDKKK